MTHTRRRQMPRELRDKWVQALRSGEYRQDTKALMQQPIFDEPGYCCLGILCMVSGLGVLKPGCFTYRNPEYDHSTGGTQWDDDDVVLLPEVELQDEELDDTLRKTFGLSNDNHGRLIEMNDYEKKSFAEIADWIEDNIPVTP